jgi:LAO/AO transport system kinase
MGLFDRAIGGDQLALARIATRIENDDPFVLAELDRRFELAGAVHVIGITGPPGAGKSTLINALLAELRKSERRIAVLLVDPSSVSTGGAVLGDRIRMLEWGDADVFVRSQATRGQEGGLAASTSALVDLFAISDFGMVLIETVGVGQDGIDIREVCDTTVVVQSPHQGDGIQALKAGILEIADIFVVTKADLPGSHQTVRDLNAMVHLSAPPSAGWVTPVVAVSGSQATGLGELADAITRHGQQRGSESDRVKHRRRWELGKRAEAQIARSLRHLDVDEGTSRTEQVAALLKLASVEIQDSVDP